MKNFNVTTYFAYFIVFVCCIQSSLLFAQFPVPGTCSGNCQSNPPSRNGNGFLGQSFFYSQQGLEYVTTSLRLGQRLPQPGVQQPAPFNVTGLPCNGNVNVVQAIIWASSSGNGIGFNINVTNPNNQSFVYPAQLIGSDQDKCWGYQGSHTYRIDVTSSIAGNGNYTMSGFPTGSPNDIDGATLMIIYIDPQSSNIGNLIIRDGALVGIGNNSSTTINGFNIASNPLNERAFIMIGDIQLVGASVTFGTQNVPIVWNWWNYVQGTPMALINQTSITYTVQVGGDCYNWTTAGFYWQEVGPPLPPGNSPITFSAPPTINNAYCLNCNGSATVHVTGGSGTYTYTWTNSVSTDSSAINLCPDTFVVNVYDTVQCTPYFISDTIIINQNNPMNTTANVSTPLCTGDTAHFAATGGNTYSWYGPNNFTSNLQNPNIPYATVNDTGMYYVIITDTSINCSDSLTVHLVVYPLPVVSASSNTPICEGQTFNLTSFGAGAYYWHGPNSFTSNIQNPSINNAVPNATGQYTVIVTDTNGCVDSASINAVVYPLPTIVVTTNSPICDGDNMNLSANGGATYVWSGPGGFSSNMQNITIPGVSTAFTGAYTVTVTDTNGCVDSSSVNVLVEPNPTVQFYADTTSGCITFCTQFNNQSQSGGSNIVSYNWELDGNTVSTQAQPIICVSTVGTHDVSLQVTTQIGCTSTLLLPDYLTGYPQPTANFGMNDNTLPLNAATVELNNLSTGGIYYFWDFGDGNTSTQENATHTYTQIDTFCILLEVTGLFSCFDDTIRCLEILPSHTFYIPSAFTPNGDGLNDVFKVYGENILNVDMMIFDRWGEKIYYTEKGTPWNGFVDNKGSTSQIGVYVYRIQIRDYQGNLHNLIGRVNLIR